MTRRAVIWGAVSSRPQTGPDKDSIERQIADSRDLLARQGWQEIAVLTVPGESRGYIDVGEAIAGLDERLQPGEDNAYRRLLELLAARAVDVLVVRSRDRLGRTDALIAGVEERCRRAGVLVWSLAMPPSGSEAGDLYVSAVERAGAQRELVELRRRQRDGMDNRLRRGLPVGTAVPFGYTAEHVQAGRRFERRAVVVPAEAAAYRQAVVDVIDRRATEWAILERLRGQFPDRRWPLASFHGTFRNPFHVGLVVRRRLRAEGETASLKVLEPAGSSLLDAPDWPEVERLLSARAGRNCFTNRDKLGRLKLTIVAPGIHEPVIDLATWLTLQRETEMRSETRRPPSRESLWGGMVLCALCGSRMHFKVDRTVRRKAYEYRYYYCSRRDRRYGDCPSPSITQAALTAGVVGFLASLYERMAGEVEALALPTVRSVDPLAGLLAQRDDLAAQRERLEIMAQTGRISLDAFDERAARVDAALVDLDARLAHERAVLASRELAGARLVALEEMLPDLAARLEAADPVTANRWLREMIEAVVVADRRVVEVRMRV